MAKHALVVAKADPERPYKTYAGMIAAFITSFLASGLDLPPIVKALGVAFLAALAIYCTPNPITVRSRRVPTVRDDGDQPTLFDVR